MSFRKLLVILSLVAMTVAYADQPSRGSGETAPEVTGGDVVPAGVVVMTSIQDLLLKPTASSIAQNNVAVGNNVLVSKTNVAISKAEAAANARLQLVEAIERIVRRSRAGDDDGDSRSISDMVGPLSTPGVSQGLMSKEAVDKQVRALLLLRSSDPITLRNSIAAFVNAVLPTSTSSSSPSSISMASVQTSPTSSATVLTSTSAEQSKPEAPEGFFGYRTLFRYSWPSTWRYGWRYPLPYWNLYGASLYPGGCGFGVAFGSYFYC